MRQGGPNNGRRPPRGRHHGGGENRGNSGGGNGGGGGSGGRDNFTNNRPRSASSLRQQSFDSNCVDLRVRGNAWQVYEKYQALARDATSGGDRVSAENYLQHAEHYYRIIEAINEATAAEQPVRSAEQPPATYGQQPEVPSNYYQPSGAPGSTSSPNAEPNGNRAPSQTNPAPQPQAEATVQQRNQPTATPFYTQEEIEEHTGGSGPLAAAR